MINTAAAVERMAAKLYAVVSDKIPPLYKDAWRRNVLTKLSAHVLSILAPAAAALGHAAEYYQMLEKSAGVEHPVLGEIRAALSALREAGVIEGGAK